MTFKDFFNQHEDRNLTAKLKAATNIRMDDASRERMRADLFEYAKMRPIRASVSAPETPLRFLWLIATHIRPVPVITAVLVVAISGGTVGAAEMSLPGDILYPVKVHLTEEVRASLATSPKAQANWAVERAERRLEEAATLALSGKLDDVRRAEINANLDEHVKRAGDSRARLESMEDSSDASEIETNIGAVRIARENILDGARGKSRAAKMAITATLADTPMPSLMSAESAPPQAPQAEDQSVQKESETRARGHRTAAKVRIEAAKKFLNRTSGIATSTNAKARERLKAATEALSSGDDDDARGKHEDASTNFESALESATEIQQLISEPNDDKEDRGEDASRKNSDGGEDSHEDTGSRD